MQLLRRVMDPKQRDEISEALKYTVQPELDGAGKPIGTAYEVTPSYLSNYYPDGLKAVTIGLQSRQLVGVTRYYPTMTPKVVVDFEPSPPELFWEEEKRQFFIEKGIVYLPIRLGETMDEEGFKERLGAATRLMEHYHVLDREQQALKEPERGVEDWLAQSDLMALLDARAIREVDAERDAQKKKLFGSARLIVIKNRKRKLLTELREGLKSGRIVDPYDGYREPAPTAE